MTVSVPVVAHREWRFLLRDFVRNHPSFRGQSQQLMQAGLSPAASAAAWLVAEHPELLARQHLTVLVPGASHPECLDGGRWFSFLPWLTGRLDLKFRVVLVGNELEGPEDLRAELARQLPGNKTPAYPLLAKVPRGDMFNGTLAQWRKAFPDTLVDACVLFAPGLPAHARSWLAEDELMPYLRNNTPLGVFSYSRMDALEDQEVLRRLDFRFTVKASGANPWSRPNERQDFMGAFGNFAWQLQGLQVPSVVDFGRAEFLEFEALQEYVHDDFMTFGADAALARLAKPHPLQKVRGGATVDRLYMLPRLTGFLESNRWIGDFDEDGFTPLEPPLLVPSDALASRPADSDELGCILWAIKLHRDVVEPMMAKREAEDDGDDELLFRGLTEEDLAEGFKSMAGKLGLPEGTDYADFMRRMRVSGGIHGPTHPAWHDLLANLGWPIEDYVDEPERLEPAFFTQGPKHAPQGLPVVCEAYAFLPDDDKDDLCIEAQDVLEEEFPDGVLLLFKGMPYTEVTGKRYSFGGLMFWEGDWHPIALNEHMTSVDSVIDQLLSGFSFGQEAPAYADDRLLASALNRMCYHMDPNGHEPMMGLRSGRWVTMMPGEVPKEVLGPSIIRKG